MIFVGDHFEFEFRTKTSNPIRCALGKRFYILLFSDNSALYENATHSVCFVVPVHYPSLVKSVSKDLSVINSVDMLFEFDNAESKKKLAAYVQGLSSHDFEIIKDLGFVGKNKRR